MKKQYVFPFVLVFLALFLGACAGGAGREEAPAATLEPTFTPGVIQVQNTEEPTLEPTFVPTELPPTFTPTMTERPSATPLPSLTPEPTNSPTATPDVFLTAVKAAVDDTLARLVPSNVGAAPEGGYPGIVQQPDGNSHWVIAIGPMPENPKCRRDDNNVDERGGCDIEAWTKYLEMYKGVAGGPGLAWVSNFSEAHALLSGNPLLRVLFSERCNLDVIDPMRPGECLVKLEDITLLNASLALPEYDGTIVFTWDADYCLYNPWPKAPNPCKNPTATPSPTATQ